MSQNMLHIVAASRGNNTSVVVGDRTALACLRDAIEQALSDGSGGTRPLSSGGEPHKIAVVLEHEMYPVYTSYAFEAAPERSGRESIPIDQLRDLNPARQTSFARTASGRDSKFNCTRGIAGAVRSSRLKAGISHQGRAG